MKALLIATLVLVAGSSATEAVCSCQCVNGRAENICQNSFDVKQACVQVCAPSIPNYGALRNNYSVTPPPGTRQCTNEQVYNNATHRTRSAIEGWRIGDLSEQRHGLG